MRLRKCGVIQILVFGDFGFKGDVLANVKVAAIQKQRREQSTHSSVAVIEGVDAQKVMDEDRNCNQRLQFHISDYAVVFLADPVQCFRRFVRGKRREQRFDMTVRIGSGDIILCDLCAPRKGVIHVAVEDFVKLQDVVLRDWYRVKALMNDTQHIAVTGDLLLIPVPRRGFLLDKLPDSGIRGDNALNGVRCLGALYLGNLHELFEFLRALLQIQFLLPGFLVYGRNQTKNVRVPLLFPDCRVIEGFHSLTSILFPLNIRIK